jgi:SRSO17 transposase
LKRSEQSPSSKFRAAIEQGLPQAPVVADEGYGTDTQFREALEELGLPYVVGIMSSVSVWKPGQGPQSKAKWKGMGPPPNYCAATAVISR